MGKQLTGFIGLAAVMVLAIVVTLGVSTFTSTTSVQAKMAEGASSEITPVGDIFSPLVAASSVTGSRSDVTGGGTYVASDTLSSHMSNTDPGAAAKYTIEFQTSDFCANQADCDSKSMGDVSSSAGGALPNGTGQITLDWDDAFGIPATIATSHVTMTASVVSGSGSTAASADVAVNPTDVTITFIGVENDEPRMVITVPDMDPAENTGGNGIGNGSNVSIIIAQAAGITNPTEGQTPTLKISTTSDTTNFSGTNSSFTTVPRLVELSGKDGSRGDTITATAKGFKNSTTATFWRDADGDGNRDAGELDLCSAEVASDDTASCSFTITVPPFDVGTAGSGGSCTYGSVSDCNFINAIDGRDNTKTTTATADITSSRFEVEGKITAIPDSGSPGDNIVVQLEDFAASDNIASMYIAGTAITTLSDGSTLLTTKETDSSGNLTVTVTIPDGVAPGKQALKVTTDAAQTQRDTVTIGGASVTATPSGSVKPNQRITLIGSGFTTGGSATINTSGDGSSISIGGADLASAKINDGSSVAIDNGGSWSTSVDLPVIPATTAGGTVELKVKDSSGRLGTTTLTFPARTLTISPTEGRVGTQVSVVGANFPAKNDEGESVTVTVTYDAGTNKTNSTTVVPDASGNFTASVQVPTSAAIPSDNTVKASFDDASSTAITVYTTDTHSVPSATIALSKSTGPAGTTVSITASGFKRFSPVSEVLAGTTDVTPAPKPATDANGQATFDITIPGLDVGSQTVKVTAASTAASAAFTVSADSTVTGVETAVATAVEPLGDSLVRVFNFNNVTKSWSFYDPRPEFADANTISAMTAGDIYWINVSAAQEGVALNSKARDLTCSDGDCWNQLVW